MSKSLKLKNNNYWDSKGIAHNKVLLSDILNYSTNEKKIGTWIDGKPVYEKTASITMTKKNEHVQGDFVASNIKYGTILHVFTSVTLSVSLYNMLDSNVLNNLYVENTPGRASRGYLCGFTARDDMLNVPIYAVVLYTKTTD